MYDSTNISVEKIKNWFEWGGREFKTNYLLLLDKLKLSRNSYEQLYGLVQTIHTFSEDTGMEFGILKCGVMVLKKEKIVNSDRTFFLMERLWKI